ncbi:hypothetical protein K2173_023500 [Erythroxylum novogranatense]|uniref:Plastid division protein PDV1 n=1 Tax=Erythroxylum novogranatense TaxID=1862640 RepID=A0AAV8S7R4_9ROSI|nr:hypothetical protein K2173_023500 [Erythroxylum novogranatense]
METEEVEAVLEKIWDLHDKLSDAIHSISRAHFLNSVKTLRKSDKKKLYSDAVDNNQAGFVFVKDFRVDDNESVMQEAKSLNAIRTALENLEDQLEFFHTVQIQQRAERDAAIARVEQSRIILAMRLAEHQGKKYKVIEEAFALVGDVQDASRFISPENLYCPAENLVKVEGRRSNLLVRVLISSFDLAKKSLKLEQVGGVLGNAALFTISMIALLHLHQVVYKEHPYKQEDHTDTSRNARKASPLDGNSSNASIKHLDVMLARG